MCMNSPHVTGSKTRTTACEWPQKCPCRVGIIYVMYGRNLPGTHVTDGREGERYRILGVMVIEKSICSGVVLWLALSVCVRAQMVKDGVVLPSATGAQTETDEYTRYELLAPETASFKIYYEVTATTAGAKFFYNPIRKGSVASDESVLDAMTGKTLVFAVVGGAEARKDPLMPKADLDTDTSRSLS